MGHFSGNICCHSFGAFHHLLTSSVFTLTFKCIPSHDVVSSQRSAQTNDTKTCQGSTVTFFLSNFCTPNNEVLKSACKLQAACNFTCAHAHAHASACNQPCTPGQGKWGPFGTAHLPPAPSAHLAHLPIVKTPKPSIFQ